MRPAKIEVEMPGLEEKLDEIHAFAEAAGMLAAHAVRSEDLEEICEEIAESRKVTLGYLAELAEKVSSKETPSGDPKPVLDAMERISKSFERSTLSLEKAVSSTGQPDNSGVIDAIKSIPTVDTSELVSQMKQLSEDLKAKKFSMPSGFVGGSIGRENKSGDLRVQLVNPDGSDYSGGGSGGSGTEYTNGATAPANPVGGTITFNDGGTMRAVSVAKPLPVLASISTAGLATDTIQTNGTQKTQIVDALGANVVSNPNGQSTMANSQPVTIASNQSSVPVRLDALQVPVTGSITTSTSAITMADLTGVGSVTVSIYGTYAGVNVTFEAYDGVNWIAVAAQPTASISPALVVSTGVLATNGTFQWNVSPLLGQSQFRVRATAWTSGSASVIINPSAQFTQFSVNVATMPSISSVVTSLVPGTGATNLGKAEDAVHATGDTGVAVWGVRNDGAATSFTSANGDYNPIGTDAQGRVYVVQKGILSTPTLVTSSTSTGVLLAANVNRVGGSIYNNSSAILYIAEAATATSSNFKVPLAANTYYEIPAGYTGVISGYWASVAGDAHVTEIT